MLVKILSFVKNAYTVELADKLTCDLEKGGVYCDSILLQ